MGKNIKKTHRRRAKSILRKIGKGKARGNAVRSHKRPRPNGKKIRVKHGDCLSF